MRIPGDAEPRTREAMEGPFMKPVQTHEWPWRFIELADSILLGLDRDGTVVYINQHGAETLDCPVSEILGKDWFENFLPERLRDDVRRIFHQVCAGAANAPERYENAVLRRDGSERIVAWRNALARDAAGNIVASLSWGEDVTEQRRTETALRTSETRFRATFEQAAVGMAHVGLDGRFLRLNKKLCELSGYSAAELKARTFPEITHPDDLGADIAQATALLAGDIPHYSMEKRYIRKDGSTVWANLTGSLVRDDQGRPDYFIAVVEDITRRKQSEALLSDGALQRLALSAAEAGAWEWDAATGRQSWTPEVYRIFGRDPAESPPDFPDWLQRCVHAEDREAVQALLRRLVTSGGGDFRVEFRTVHPRRGLRWVTSVGRVICDDENRPLRAYGLSQDMTERRRIEEALHASSERLRMAMEAGNIGVWDWDIASGRVGWSENFARLLDMDPCAMPKSLDEFTALVHPDDRQKVAIAIERALARDIPYNVEFRMICPDGRVRWAESRALVVRDRTGHPVRMIGIDMDITARKTADERQAWLMSELDQRVRGILALVQTDTASMLRGGARADHGGSAVGTPLVTGPHVSCTVAHVVAQALGRCATERISIKGQLFSLSPAAGQALTMILQDLAAHATGLGALSGNSGSVAIEWAKVAEPETMLQLSWTELGGPRGVPPNRPELSRKLLQSRMVTDFGSKVELRFELDGLRATLGMPIARVAAVPAS